ncbi:MAG: flagellar protein FlgN [Clostridiales bacterium]|nr:flagellar protein FlgN [Clostridiales bacterium]
MARTRVKNSNLKQLLNEQKQLLARFLQLTLAQAQFIASDDTDALMQNLELRAQVMDQVNALRPELVALLAEQADDTSIRGLREQTGQILQEITEKDEENRAAARERLEFFQAEIRRVGKTRKGVGAYIKGTEIFSSEFIDECK